jgi:DNA gyrase subunit B
MRSGRTGTEVTFLPRTETFTMTDFAFGRWSTGCANWPSSIPASASCCRRARRPSGKRRRLLYEGGVEAFVRYLDRSKTPLIRRPIAVTGERTASRSSRAVVE